METTNQTNTSGMMANPLTLPLIVGLVGAGLMALGTFLPFVGAPIVGSVNYFGKASGGGAIVVISAVVAAICFLVKFYFIPILSSLAAGSVMVYDLYKILSETSGYRSKSMVQVEFGVFVIAVGIIAVLSTAIWSYQIKRKMKQGK